MRSALYYPHTSIDDERLVKTALLLWDELEFIVPYAGFQPEYDNREIRRAMEMIGAPHEPSDEEKRQTHEHVEELIERRLPPPFYYSPQAANRDDSYEVYPQKLLPETWRMLHSSKLSGALLPNADYPMSEPAGLTVMSILADSCAGTTRARVTDRGAAYATLAGILGSDSGDPAADRKSVGQHLVPLTLEVIDLHSINLSKLIAFREKEAKQTGRAIRDLRHRYTDSLETYAKRLATEKGTARDAEEIKRQFADDMKIDVGNLRQELGFARRDALFSQRKSC